jgi:hypothetical protein
MMSFNRINRRTHLYLGLALLPWLLMYGVSSWIIIHKSIEPLPRELLYKKSYTAPVDLNSPNGSNNTPQMRAAAQQILKDLDMQGAFWVDKPNSDTLHIDRFSFRGNTTLTYSAKKQELKVEHQKMRVPQVIQRLHFRGGYIQPDLGNQAWGVFVDAACIAILIWVISGVIMWWQLPKLRAWGTLALAGGILSFVILTWIL